MQLGDMTPPTVGAFVVGVTASALATYILYKTATSSRASSFLKRRWMGSGEAVEDDDLDREVAFHFADRKAYVPFPHGPSASNFASRCAVLCEKYTTILQDFTGEQGEPACLDVGCSIGATTMELSKSFAHVMGVDASKKRIAVAEELKEKQIAEFSSTIEGDIKETTSVTLDPLYELDNVRFTVKDPCALAKDLLAVDCVLAALSLDRMSNPKRFVESLPRLVKKDGTAVLVTLYDWDSDGKGFGNDVNEDGKRIRSEDALKDIMKDLGFELVYEENIPFLKRETERMYQWHVPHATVWRFRGETTSL